MDKDDIKKLIDNIGYDDLKLLRKESTRELSKVRLRDRIKFTIYLPKEFSIKYERAVSWAFEKGLIKKRTRWSFTKFCVTNIISMIITEMEKEQAEKENEEMARRSANTNPFDLGAVRQG